MSLMRTHAKLIGVAASCAALGAGASAIASAGAATSSPAQSVSGAKAGHHRGLGARRLLGRAVHGDVVVATKTGFVTITFDRGFVQSVSGQQLTLREGTKTHTYKTVTLTIPAGARVRDNGRRATLGALKPGQRALVLQGVKRTTVIAHNARA
jgi:hypothetical protein